MAPGGCGERAGGEAGAARCLRYSELCGGLAAGSRGRGLPEAPAGVLALPGGAPAELGAAAGGGLARGDGGRRRAATPRGGRAQGGGASGRRLPEASARAGASGPQGERQRHAG